MKNILVTGGAGYVGSNLIKSLINQIEDVKITSLDCYFTGNTQNHIESSKVKYIEGSTIDIFEIFHDQKFDTIFHFGEYSRIVQSFDDINFVIDSISRGTQEVIKYATIKKSRLIYSASSSKFGNDGNDENLSPYSFFKAKNIELIKNYRDWFGLDYEICYFYNVYGDNHIRKGKYATVIGIFENQIINGEPLTVVKPGDQSRDFTHIQDVCKGILAASEMNINGEYFLRFGKNYTLMEVAERFSNNINLIPKRRGERFSSVYVESESNDQLPWKAEIDLMDYIDDFKLKNL